MVPANAEKSNPVRLTPAAALVDRQGRLLEKKWLLGMSLAEALRFAIDDFKFNYAKYIKNFR